LIFNLGMQVKKKKAVITIELVEESVFQSNDTLEKEIFKSLSNEMLGIPWLAEVKKVRVVES
jgi:hypothetical protein